MKFKADTVTDVGIGRARPSRVRRYTWAAAKLAARHYVISTALGFVGWYAAKDPAGTWTAATNIAAKLAGLVKVLSS